MRSTCAFRAFALAIVNVFAMAPSTFALGDPAVDAVQAGLRAATVSIVGTVSDTRASRRRSSFGDEIIVTTAIVRVGEILRGQSEAWVPLEVEGGTLDGLTMAVSDAPLLNRGDRAVFLIDRLRDGRFVLHRRGSGILPLRSDDHIADSALTLADVRRFAQEAR